MKEMNYDYEVMSITPTVNADSYNILVKIKEPEFIFYFENIKFVESDDLQFAVDISVLKRTESGDLVKIDDEELNKKLNNFGEELITEIITKIITDSVEPQVI